MRDAGWAGGEGAGGGGRGPGRLESAEWPWQAERCTGVWQWPTVDRSAHSPGRLPIFPAQTGNVAPRAEPGTPSDRTPQGYSTPATSSLFLPCTAPPRSHCPSYNRPSWSQHPAPAAHNRPPFAECPPRQRRRPLINLPQIARYLCTMWLMIRYPVDVIPAYPTCGAI